MTNHSVSSGTVHTSIATDFKKVLVKNPIALSVWEDITPLARNEWLCWIESAKLIETQQRRITLALKQLSEGKRRPCCWAGCIHRKK